ncbi:hypothetical protein EES43_28975 [Streptomyces sp. ADI96-02]|uniref:hypothetical protein n=1 Tax=unclassified Streptomyces TaxID=2593676 RepID=UPI000F99718D|nr:hypothetical protein [Streptomyces sp. ADI96-02]RPK54609.1 hypothetical protein EES43_28975 [Streptomyces sp. ADI96-02]
MVEGVKVERATVRTTLMAAYSAPRSNSPLWVPPDRGHQLDRLATLVDELAMSLAPPH